MIKFLRHIFIPHAGNNHRSKLIHNSSLLILSFFLLFTSWISIIVNNTHPEVLGISYSMTDQELLLQVNQKRIENGVEPLKLNVKLNQAAASKAAYMFENDFWAHYAPDGTTPWKFVTDNGYDYIYAGENLAKGFTKTTDVIDAWMESPTHRDNMLSGQYKDVGFAIVEGNLQGEETVLIVQMFGQEKNRFLTSADTDFDNSIEGGRAEVASANETVEVPLIDNELSTQESLGVTLYESKPSVDMLFTAKSLSFFLISVLLIALILDFIVVSKKRIPRIVGNNLDHIFILSIFLVFIFIYNIGTIL